jgi:hypothetical protein
MTEALVGALGSEPAMGFEVERKVRGRSTCRDQVHDPKCPSACLSAAPDVRLSIVMPVYNEQRTVQCAVEQVLAFEAPCPVELIVVDDGSTDRTPHILSEFNHPRLTLHRHHHNRGKGAALHSGIARATGTHLLPFDADLEYLVDDIPRLLAPVLAGTSDVVFGTRLFGQNTVYQSYRYALGNRATTLAANLLFDAALSDLHTCFKLVPLDLVRLMELTESGFGFDTEMTASLLRAGVRPFEVPISYLSRDHSQGKKLTWKDGVRCLRILGRARAAGKGSPASGTRRTRPTLVPVQRSPEPALPTDVVEAAAVSHGG